MFYATGFKDTIKKLMGGSNSDLVIDSSILSRALPRSLTPSQSMILDNPIIDEEIQKIFFSLKDNRLPVQMVSV